MFIPAIKIWNPAARVEAGGFASCAGNTRVREIESVTRTELVLVGSGGAGIRPAVAMIGAWRYLGGPESNARDAPVPLAVKALAVTPPGLNGAVVLGPHGSIARVGAWGSDGRLSATMIGHVRGTARPHHTRTLTALELYRGPWVILPGTYTMCGTCAGRARGCAACSGYGCTVDTPGVDRGAATRLAIQAGRERAHEVVEQVQPISTDSSGLTLAARYAQRDALYRYRR